MAEFKELAVKLINDGQSISVVPMEFGLSDQTVRTGSRRRNKTD